MKPAPEQIQQRVKWLADIAQAEKLTDKGYTLLPAEARTIHADKSVTHAPHSEGNEIVTGYVVVQAETTDEAVEMAKANPIFGVGGSDFQIVCTFQVAPTHHSKLTTIYYLCVIINSNSM